MVHQQDVESTVKGQSRLGATSFRVRSTWTGKATIALLVMLGLPALFGGWALMTPGPGQAPLGMPLEWLKSTPFHSYFIPGLLLFSVFGVGSMIATLAGLLRHRTAPYLAFVVGIGQMIWIAVEVIMFSPMGIMPLQPLMFSCGAMIATLAYAWWLAGYQA